MTSYITNAEADTYFLGTFNAAAWAALTEDEKTVALAEATRWLETICYSGALCDEDQPLQWPRAVDATGCCPAAVCPDLPAKMVQATAELALALHRNPESLLPPLPAGPGRIGFRKREKLGDLEVEYYAPSRETLTGAGRVGPSAPLVLQAYPWLVDMIGCWITSSIGTARLVELERS